MSTIVKNNSEQDSIIPVERGVPLLGILPMLFGRDPFDFLRRIMLKQGDFVQVNFGPQPVYLVSNPDYLQRILRDNYQNYRKPAFLYNAAKEISQDGLITSSGELWMRQRRMIGPHLHRKQLVHLYDEIVDSIAEVVDGWKMIAESGQVINLGEAIPMVTMNVISRTMFGRDILSKKEMGEVGKNAVRLIQYLGKSVYTSFLPKWFKTPERIIFEKDLTAMKRIVNHIVQVSRERKETSASLIQMLLNSVDEDTNQGMSEQQLFDEVMTIFIAGYETTATALTWLGVVINQHPEIQDKLHEEIDRVLGKRQPVFEDLHHLTYTRQVFAEILRMYTVTAFLPRALNEPDKLGNYELPAESLVMVFYHGVHHNPQVWDEPEEFRPERFTPENIAARHPFAYLPFSAGPRKCAGDEFALLEAPLIIAMFLQRYKIHVLAEQKFDVRFGATMRPLHGVKVTLSSR